MTAVNVQLPEPLHAKAREVAKAQNLSIDELIASALAQRLARLIPDSYLEERARRADGAALSDVLNQVPDVSPEEEDRL
jgi:hypothetical protein